MASGIRQPQVSAPKTGLPIPSKFGLNEMTESQSNSRLPGPQIPTTTAFVKKNKFTENSIIPDPPAKHRKINDRPASAQQIARPLSHYNTTQTSKLGQSVSSYRNPQSLINPRNQLPQKSHSRSKSQVALKPSQLQNEPPNGMQPFPTSNDLKSLCNLQKSWVDTPSEFRASDLLISPQPPVAIMYHHVPPKICNKNCKPSPYVAQCPRTSPRRSPQKSPKRKLCSPTKYLTKDSNLTNPDWNDSAMENRLDQMESMFHSLKGQMEGTSFEKNSMKELIEIMKLRIVELETIQRRRESEIEDIRSDKERLYEKNRQLLERNGDLDIHIEKMILQHKADVDSVHRLYQDQERTLSHAHRQELSDLKDAAASDVKSTQAELERKLDNLNTKHREEINKLHESHQKMSLNNEAIWREKVEELETQRNSQLTQIATTIGEKERESDRIQQDLDRINSTLEQERMIRQQLETTIQTKTVEFEKLLQQKQEIIMNHEFSNKNLADQINFLQSSEVEQNKKFEELDRGAKDAYRERDEVLEKMRKLESQRRKLHNQVQELKGNIRVFCRIRPVLPSEENAAKITYPDENEDGTKVEVLGPEQKSATGKDTTKTKGFTFNRVFGPKYDNPAIFDELREFVQSALDGFNCCIFSYGQTGTGKTYLMSNPDGMIPLAVAEIYRQTSELALQGWTYALTGRFVEVYNEHLNDLLSARGRADLDSGRLQIHHDMDAHRTNVPGLTERPLQSPEHVHAMLAQADAFRSVAATAANQRSSRSHSVFILGISGRNSVTGETCEGELNLVDLAGSERLAHSKAEGDRLKETQNINKSLSALSDVISALSAKAGHIPYNNSTLTKLLRFSLGGNSKTLMFVMISPLQAHLGQSLTSLEFATKVNNTHIGAAKRQVKK